MGGVGAGGGTGRSRGRRNGSNLPLCPHCTKIGKHKPDNCFLLPANAGKKPANFFDGKFVYEKKVKGQGPGQVSDCVDIKWINKNRPKGLLYAPIITRNYYAPLTSQVDTLEQVQDQLLSAIHQRSDPRKTKCISFSLPSSHTDKDSTEWRRRRSSNKST
jgi:hypothetical protein